MSTRRYDVVIVGGGIVGLSVALEITRRFPRLGLLLLEKEDRVARHQSGHNSGVIHSGIYYKPGSLKARLCVEGNPLARAYWDAHDIPYKMVGKVIVGTEESELVRLGELYERGRLNGIDNLELLDTKQIE